MASTYVGSPMISCQRSTGSCEVMAVERRPYRSSRISSRSWQAAASRGSRPDQKIGTAEIAQETRMATVAARQREILE